ncbi:Angiogenic factor with G patch and FHA domains 1 [Halotydeus destructor]|nr:Angiogenic factor with G patch and FHA domains 1 [Halotydeus destructor]
MEKDVRRLQKENEKLLRVNEDLRQQVELLTAKLHLHQKIGSVSVVHSKSTQTASSITESSKEISQVNSNKSSNLGQEKGWLSNGNDTANVADLVRAAASEQVSINDYEYDEASKTYHSRSTGWYYYPERKLFYNPHDKNFYTYDEIRKEFAVYKSTVQDSESKKKASSKKVDLILLDEDDQEDGELITDDDGECSEDSDSEEDDFEKLAPVRLIIVESSSQELGSLLLASCIGATLGSSTQCDICLPDDSVAPHHASIRYSSKRYLIGPAEDCTVCLNSQAVEQETTLHHGDVLVIGSCKLLAHIHESRDITCIQCEPGCVQSTLMLSNKADTIVDAKLNPKATLNQLKRKYGLKQDEFLQKEIKLAEGFNDRSENRRKVKGSSDPNAKTEQASVDVSITKKNKGFRMLEKLGWSEGEGLGKESSGISEPIAVQSISNRAGLGSDSVVSPPVAKTTSRKLEAWRKTQNRFNQLN